MRSYLHRLLFVVTGVGLGTAYAVFAAPMEDGQAAYNQGDFKKAFELWRPLAEEGTARAQSNLGVLYENGKGVPADMNEALKWYRLAAEQGYAGAQNNLGLIYATGKGVMRDPVLAYMWFDLAAQSLTGDLAKTVASSRDVIAGSLSPEQAMQAVEMSRRCKAANYKQCESGASVAIATTPAVTSTPAIATTSHDVTANDYPSDALRFHESGSVTVTYVINEQGSVSTCSVVLTSGNGRLDEAACNLVKRRWKYRPATENGKPVTIQYISKIVFERK